MNCDKMVSVLALSTVICACAGDGPDGTSFTTRDSAGIHIVENVAPAWNADDAWHLSEQPVVDIGAFEGDPDYELYRVSSVARMPDGRIVIGNAGTNQLRFYDETGVHLFDVGGEGEGPGEFRFINWVSLYRGDSLAVHDMRNMRISIFDSDGELGRSFPVRGVDESGRGQPHGVFADGSVLVGILSFGSRDAAGGESREPEPLYVFSPDGESKDSLLASPGMERFMHSASNNMVFVGSPMFGRSTEYGVQGSRFYVASNDSYEVHVYAQDGNLQSIICRQFEHLQVTDADVDSMRARQLGDDTPAGARDAMIELLDAMPIRETMPAYRGIMLDRGGNLWVEEYRRPGDRVPRWTVFSAEGEFLGTLAVPERFAVHDIGDDYVLGRWADDMDIEHVRMYELVKP